MFENRKRILLADDNRMLRITLKIALSDDFDVTDVGDGVSMEEALNTQAFDLVISDLNLPRRSGTMVLRRTDHIELGNQRIDNLGVPTIVITGMDPDDDDVHAVRRMTNVMTVLFKPLDTEGLRKAVYETLQGLASPAAELPQAAIPGGAMKTALMVDDDPDIRDICSLALEPYGIQVRGCASVETALEYAAQHEFDLILLDYQIDDDTGLEFLETLRARVGAERIPPTLVISAFGAFLKEGLFEQFPQVKQIFVKPFDPDELVEVACGMLQSEARHPKVIEACTSL